MIVEGKPLFVVVTRYATPDKRVIVHTYGPWSQRKSAQKYKQRFEQTPGLEAFTCKVLGVLA